MALRFISDPAGCDPAIEPLPPFRVLLRVAGQARRGPRVAGATPARVREMAQLRLSSARIVCPRRGRIDGDCCLRCSHLVGWSVAPSLRLYCAADGDDPVFEWMSLRPVWALARTPCADADRAAEVAGVHHLIVLDDEGQWAGILCRCDLAGGGAAPVGERMSRDIYAVGPATPLRVALGAMKQLGVGSLPVVDGQRLVGVLSSRHLRRAGIADIE